jgi:hypothetical protein
MSSTNTQSTDNVSSDTITKSVMLELEKKAEIQVAQLASNIDQKPDFGEKLVSIMSSGAQEFKEKTGRQMTYGEMRAMYG